MVVEGSWNGGKFQCDVGVIIIVLWHVANEKGFKGSVITSGATMMMHQYVRMIWSRKMGWFGLDPFLWDLQKVVSVFSKLSREIQSKNSCTCRYVVWV